METPKSKIQIASEIFSFISESYIRNTPRPIILEALEICKDIVKVLDKKPKQEEIKEEHNGNAIIKNAMKKIVEEPKKIGAKKRLQKEPETKKRGRKKKQKLVKEFS